MTDESGSPWSRSGFRAFFATQLLSAFNDNFFKNAVVIGISSSQASLFGLSPAAMISLCSAVFIVPFFLFSATAGQLADRFAKSQVIRAVKIAEIAIMAVAGIGFLSHSLLLELVSLFAMGIHSAFLGPAKYSILPELVAPSELVQGNAWVEMGTFLAILGGTLTGGLLVLAASGGYYVSATMAAVAVIGLALSLRIPKQAPADPTVRIDANPLAPTLSILRITKRSRAVFLSVLGISFFWLFGAVLLSVLPVFAREVLHAQEQVVTLFLTLFCVGIATGSLLTERISGKNLELGLVPVGSAGLTLFTLDLAFTGVPVATGTLYDARTFLALEGSTRILVDLFGMAMFGGFFTVPLYTLIQQRAEEKERSRVVAGNNILNALFMAVGSALLAVAFAYDVSVRTVLLVLSAVSLAAAVYIYTLLPEFLLRFAALVLSRVMYRVTVKGHERIPEHGPAVLVCNHVAFNDWLIVAGAVRRPARFVMDHRIASTPVIRTLIRQGKVIPIAPQHEDAALMESAFAKIAEELRSGEIVCIYPEGKITRDGELNAFKSGIERILRETPVPVVPMALDGLWGSMFSRKDGPAFKKLPKRFRARITLTIGEPVAPSEASAPVLEAKVRALLDSMKRAA